MIYSTRYASLALRLGLAAVFFWFGVDKFFHPAYWLNAWVPPWAVELLGKFGVTGTQFIYLNGVFETLIGLSLLTGVFTRFFSLLGILFLTSVLFMVGLSEITIRDLGLIGGLASVFLWPERQR